MKILLSPAKLMRNLPSENTSEPSFQVQATRLASILAKWSVQHYIQRMGLSKEKAKETQALLKNWLVEHESAAPTPAIFAYIGEAFKALDTLTLDPAAQVYLNENVYILSGLYGLLNANDGVLPYRLEMAQKLAISKNQQSLYAFWRPQVEAFLTSHLESNEPILNLASSEYTDLIQDQKLVNRMLTPIFKENKGGKLQSVSVFSKQARGTIARWCATEKISDPKQIRDFKLMGYAFQADLSDEKNYFFVRT
jgi:cytoplasmic iron level regulating protein YaaA (DUF328/UPF0246 family)